MANTQISLFEIHQTKKPFNKNCGLVIEYAKLINIPFTDESKDVKDLQSFYEKLNNYYVEIKKNSASKSTPVIIELNARLGCIWISRPMKCESPFLTIKINPDYARPGKEDAV